VFGTNTPNPSFNFTKEEFENQLLIVKIFTKIRIKYEKRKGISGFFEEKTKTTVTENILQKKG
jgi:hypothetical protein